ncbi:Mediator of RNA polymerase II transcription subunit 13 like [Cucumis melo var. makuwa]|uniref:Mediator of RNA polymerase II transcription subunit 13 like n=1 Tax=Cucumis melo var. makuwa TaxID=1194695 RepID=A0A5D3D077_CUCMM|nr:Mediator of RNA polymerase II transcription subunit 13 like [Cucumis melo var. makuwa]TYK16056.1 Mediator of RNA polymerase II transcription subunit 13 like [Cucumis melo var. makuwa]
MNKRGGSAESFSFDLDFVDHEPVDHDFVDLDPTAALLKYLCNNILLEAGAFEWRPAPFPSRKNWLYNKECCQLIKITSSKFHSQDWVGFVISAKLRKLKTVLKEWQINDKSEKKRKEGSILGNRGKESVAEKQTDLAKAGG